MVIIEEYEDVFKSIVHHNLLVLEQWKNKLMTDSSSKLQNEQSEVLFLQNKKAFLKVQGII